MSYRETIPPENEGDNPWYRRLGLCRRQWAFGLHDWGQVSLMLKRCDHCGRIWYV